METYELEISDGFYTVYATPRINRQEFTHEFGTQETFSFGGIETIDTVELTKLDNSGNVTDEVTLGPQVITENKVLYEKLLETMEQDFWKDPLYHAMNY